MIYTEKYNYITFMRIFEKHWIYKQEMMMEIILLI